MNRHTRRPGRSGYQIVLGQIIQNSGNQNSYPILVLKTLPEIQVPYNSDLGSGIPDLPKFLKIIKYTNFSSNLYKFHQ
jgi:hypothetical protein